MIWERLGDINNYDYDSTKLTISKKKK